MSAIDTKNANPVTRPNWAIQEVRRKHDDGAVWFYGPLFPIELPDDEGWFLRPEQLVTVDGVASDREVELLAEVDGSALGQDTVLFGQNQITPGDVASLRALADAYARVADYLEEHEG